MQAEYRLPVMLRTVTQYIRAVTKIEPACPSIPFDKALSGISTVVVVAGVLFSKGLGTNRCALSERGLAGN